MTTPEGQPNATLSLDELRQRAEALQEQARLHDLQIARAADQKVASIDDLRMQQVQAHERLEAIPAVISGYEALKERGVELQPDDQELYEGLVAEQQQLQELIDSINARVAEDMNAPEVGGRVYGKAETEDRRLKEEQKKAEIIDKYTKQAQELADEVWERIQYVLDVLRPDIAGKNAQWNQLQSELSQVMEEYERDHGVRTRGWATRDFSEELKTRIAALGFLDKRKGPLKKLLKDHGEQFTAIGKAWTELQDRKREESDILNKEFSEDIRRKYYELSPKVMRDELQAAQVTDLRVSVDLHRVFTERIFAKIGANGPDGKPIRGMREYERYTHPLYEKDPKMEANPRIEAVDGLLEGIRGFNAITY